MRTASISSFIWTILLIVILICFVFVSLTQESKSKLVRNNISALNQENANYQRIDSCISVLYDAENNSRLFVITQDSTYLRKYKKQLNFVSNSLTEFEAYRTRDGKSLSGMIGDKRQKDQQFVDMKILVDSLLSFSFQIRELNKSRLKRPVTVTKRRTVETAKTDSVYVDGQKNKNRLFKRIADAIANKERKERSSASSEKSVVIKDSVGVSEVTQEDELANMFDQFEKARLQLKETERQMLLMNGRIFANLKNILRQMKVADEAEMKAIRAELLEDTQDQFEEVNKLSTGNVLIVLGLIALIVWNLIRLYRQKVALLEYARQTAETTRKKREFMSHMAHEIRTPLNSVIGFAQLIDTEKLDEQLKGNVNAIKNSSKTLLTLVNEILDFSKFEGGKITLKNQPFHPVKLLSEAEEMLSVLAAEKRIVLHTHYGMQDDLTLIGDVFWIKQVVVNLLTNGIKFTPNEGSVSLHSNFEIVDQDKGHLHILVKDSGVGIAKENLDRIFEDFIQVEPNDVTSRQVGTGLGLAICKKIVDLYGGSIGVESEIGKGATFKVLIPLSSTKEIAPGKKPASRTDRIALKGKKILIADDTKMNLILASKIMDKHGVDYDLANDGREAFQFFEGGKYDLVITDIEMPVLNGIQLTGLIRKFSEKSKSEVPILAFTGSSTEDNKRLYLATGINDVVEKPYDEQHFLDVIEGLIKEGSAV